MRVLLWVCSGFLGVLASLPDLGAAERILLDDEAVAALLAKAQTGDAAAQYQLGRHYYYEYNRFLGGRDVDIASATFFWRMAALQGHARAMTRLGDCHSQGWGMKVDTAAALVWYRKAAAQSDADAQVALCAMYEFGAGVPVDKKEAARWRKLALAQHHPIAQYEQGQMLLGGRKDEAEALRLLRLAAEQDHVPAQNQLGLCYKEGRGVKQSLVEAYAWQHLSSDTHALSRQWRDETARRMSAGEMAEGRERAGRLRLLIDLKGLAKRLGAVDDGPDGEP